MSTCVLFVTTNGVGLGHVTRSMAVARRLDEDLLPVVFTMSQAVPIVRRQGFLVEHLPSAGVSGVESRDWQLLLAHRLEYLCETYDPAVVIFDGAAPYHGLCARIVADRERTWVWNRRAMWRPGTGAGALRLAKLFDRVIEPGEVAARADRGLTVTRRREVDRVSPMLLCRADETLDRTQAREKLELQPDATCALVQLGAGRIDDTGSLRGIAVSVLREHGVHVVVGESPLAAVTEDATSAPEAPGIDVRRTYPLEPLLAAFDLAVAAPGYNSFHELVAAGVPTVFAPNVRTKTDDQVARARFADLSGIGRAWEDHTTDGFSRAVAPLLDGKTRSATARACRAVHMDDGAEQAARIVERLAGERRP